MQKVYTSAFKAQVVQALLKETKTLPQLAAAHGIHPNVVREWKATALNGFPELFARGDSVAQLRTHDEQQIEALYAHIGRLTTHVGWLKKIWPRL